MFLENLALADLLRRLGQGSGVSPQPSTELGYREVAEKLAAHRGAEVWTFEPADLATLRERLRELRPQRVAVVLRPEQVGEDVFHEPVSYSLKKPQGLKPGDVVIRGSGQAYGRLDFGIEK